jgi:hypothetical protein
MYKFNRWFLFFGIAAAAAVNVAAQDAALSGYNGPGTLKLDGLTITGSLRSRAYGWDWFDTSSGNSNYGYSGNLLRVSISQSRKQWDWTTEFAAPFLLGLPDDATAPAPQGALGLGSNYFTANKNNSSTGMVFLKQAFVRIKGERTYLQLGRFEYNDGTELTPKNATLATLKSSRISQRLIGAFGWSDVGRSYDGGHFDYSKGKNDFTAMFGVPTRGVFQTDGWGWNRVGVGYAAYTRDWGTGKHAADTRVFFIDYIDWRNTVLKSDNRAAAVRRADLADIRIESFGGHSLHAFTTSAGTIDALIWGVGQTGSWGTQKQRAYAIDAEGGYQPSWKAWAKLKPWFRGGYTKGSGDDNPNDNTHGTFFQILPTPRPYARMPFFNMMNMEDRFGSLVLRPHAKVTVSSEYHSLRLSNAADLWYSGGGVYQPWTFGYTGRATSGRRSLANLYDTNVELRANKYLTLTGYLGYAQGLAAIHQIYPAGTKGSFGYLEMLFRF